jgi:hypothetical protein
MNDLAWIMFLGIVSTFVVQLIVIGFAILCDRRTAPVFPRWVGYLNLWMALLFTPATVLIFFKSGPFAWDGLLVWWLPFAAFVLWFPVNTFFLLKAVREDDYAAIDDDRHHELRRDIDQLITEIALLRTVVSGGTASSSG